MQPSLRLSHALGQVLRGPDLPLGLVDPIEFIQSGEFLGQNLWDTEKTILKLIYGLELTRNEERILERWSSQGQVIHHPGHRVQEAVLCLGMRSCKTFLSSGISLYETYRYLSMPDPWKVLGLARRSPVFGIVVATSLPQARDTVWAQIRSKLDDSPYFSSLEMIAPPQGTTIYFPTHEFTIRTGGSTSSGLVGRTSWFVVLDELARMPDTRGRLGGREIYLALSRSTKTLDGLVLDISSPLYVDDTMMQLLDDAGNEASMLGLRLATWLVNPTLPRSAFDKEFKQNPEMAARDFGAEPCSAIEPYYRDPAKIDEAATLRNAITDSGQLAEGWRPSGYYPYVVAGDPALKNDAFGIAVAHAEPGMAVVDLAFRLVPRPELGVEVKAAQVREVFEAICGRVTPDAFVFDVKTFPEMMQDLERVAPVRTNLVLKEEHDALKERVYSGTVRLPGYPVLVDELKALELVKGERVDHRRGRSKDVADAVANAVFNLPECEGAVELPRLF